MAHPIKSLVSPSVNSYAGTSRLSCSVISIKNHNDKLLLQVQGLCECDPLRRNVSCLYITLGEQRTDIIVGTVTRAKPSGYTSGRRGTEIGQMSRTSLQSHQPHR